MSPKSINLNNKESEKPLKDILKSSLKYSKKKTERILKIEKTYQEHRNILF